MCSHRILPVLSKFQSFCFACIAIFILPTLFPTDLSAVVYTPPIIQASQDATIKASVSNENRGAGTPFYVQQSFGLCSFDFSTQGFTPETGTWAISNGRYHVSAGPSNRISLGRVHCNDCVARVTARTGSGSTYPNNGFIIFDHVNSSNYKLAGFNAETGKWVIGEMVSGAFMVKTTAARTFQQSTDYTFDVRLVSSTKTFSITLSGSQSPIVSYTFSTLNASRISLGTVFSKEGWFDDFDVFLGGPGTEGEDRALIKFDQSQIASEIGTAQLVQAKLWVYLEKSQWADSGHNIVAHRLTSDWSENNVTWNCASDSNTSNGLPDCASQWAGGSYISQPTASVLHAHDQVGWVAFDVTADVNAFLSGTANYGWLLKKNAEPDKSYGVISYTSRDGTPVNTPNLMLYIQDDTPPTITPVINPAPNAAGWNRTDVTVSFICSDSDSGIRLCPSPITVSSEGANQVISGTVQDNAGNNASTAVTINLDKTAPNVQILAPSDGVTVSQDTLQVLGTASDSLSGISSVACGDFPASFEVGSFDCLVTLLQGTNPITVSSIDAAGNQQELAFDATLQAVVLGQTITDVQPLIIPADSFLHPVQIYGQNLTPSMLLYLDDVLIPFDFIDDERVTITVSFSNSSFHFLEIRDADGDILVAWEKGIIAGKSNEIVLSQSSGPISGGTILSVYTLDPIFEEETQVSFMDTQGNSLPADTNFISGNELEVTTPQAAEGVASVIVDNPINLDLQGTDLFTFSSSAPSSPITSQAVSLPACTCRIKPTGTFTITAGTSGYRRFKAFTENCAGSMLQCGKRFQITYYVDGVTSLTSCNELAIREDYAEWVFPVNSTHTIGVQLVEWWPESVWNEDGKGKHIEKACVPYGPIVNVPVKIQGASSGDSDGDGILNSAETFFMNTYQPAIYQNCADEILDYGDCITANSETLRVGPIMYKKPAPRVDILMSYTLVYPEDRGCKVLGIPVGGHTDDTEPFGYLLQKKDIYPDAAPSEYPKWKVKYTKAIGHDGEVGEKISTENGFWNSIFVSARKHANYLHPCNSWYQQTPFVTCDDCNPYQQRNYTPHNVGNTQSYGGNCFDIHGTAHLINSGYKKVPEKWSSTMKHFGLKYRSPFNDQ